MKVKAKWWETTDKGKILCTLCPRFCKMKDGQTGFCFIRKNEGGVLYQMAYGRPTGFAVDPIEKKPLNHFLPGTSILSFGTAGCNLGCRFCQNWDMSKAKLNDLQSVEVSAEDVVKLARKRGCPSIAYTYNDPVIFGEFVMDVSKLAREEGIKNVMVTAGYITPEAREDVFRNIDAANVDLKAFTDSFYHKLSFAHLEDVLDTIQWIAQKTDIRLEITTLVIPGKNDSPEEIGEMVEWILEHTGDEVPLHFTAFHPDFKMINIPRTPISTLINLRNLARDKGMKYVYIGNVFDSDGQTTFCPNCNKSLILRSWHTVVEKNLQNDRCSCGMQIPIVWS